MKKKVNQLDTAPSPSVKNEMGVDLEALARKVYALFQQELRIEQERGRPRSRLGG
jgi:hypothetical protein